MKVGDKLISKVSKRLTFLFLPKMRIVGYLGENGFSCFALYIMTNQDMPAAEFAAKEVDTKNCQSFYFVGWLLTLDIAALCVALYQNSGLDSVHG